MAEVLRVIASVITIAEVGHSLHGKLVELARSISAASDDLKQIATALDETNKLMDIFATRISSYAQENEISSKAAHLAAGISERHWSVLEQLTSITDFLSPFHKVAIKPTSAQACGSRGSSFTFLEKWRWAQEKPQIQSLLANSKSLTEELWKIHSVVAVGSLHGRLDSLHALLALPSPGCVDPRDQLSDQAEGTKSPFPDVGPFVELRQQAEESDNGGIGRYPSFKIPASIVVPKPSPQSEAGCETPPYATTAIHSEDRIIHESFESSSAQSSCNSIPRKPVIASSASVLNSATTPFFQHGQSVPKPMRIRTEEKEQQRMGRPQAGTSVPRLDIL